MLVHNQPSLNRNFNAVSFSNADPGIPRIKENLRPSNSPSRPVDTNEAGNDFYAKCPALLLNPKSDANEFIPSETRYRAVLQILNQALQSATNHRRNAWDFAIEISKLTNLGIGKHLLRVMVCQGDIAHKRETTQAGQNQRSFAPEPDVVLSERSCFVISEKGLRQFESASNRKEPIMPKRPHFKRNNFSDNGKASVVPVWDKKRRELRLGDVVVKRFKWPASNQEQVLEAFQEEGWPVKIDDPLPPNPSICPKRRLHDTIKCLNRRQVNEMIKFRGDGTGQGVLLEICVPQKNKTSK